jgi:hypothetical protein
MRLRHESVRIITVILRRRFIDLTDTQALHIAYEIVEELDKPSTKVTNVTNIKDEHE